MVSVLLSMDRIVNLPRDVDCQCFCRGDPKPPDGYRSLVRSEKGQLAIIKCNRPDAH